MASSSLVDRLNTLSYGGALGIALILGGLYYLSNYDDGAVIIRDTRRIQKDIEKETEKKKKTEDTLREAETIKSDVAILAEKFRVASAKLPSELKSQQLVDMIRSVVQNAGCRLVTIRPLAIEKKPLYDEYPISIEIRGTYSNLVVFMFYVAAIERITNVRDFNISNVEDNAPGGVLRLETSVVSYRFRSEAAGTSVKSDNKVPDKKGGT